MLKKPWHNVHFTVVGNNNIVGSVWYHHVIWTCILRVGVHWNNFFSPLSYDTGSKVTSVLGDIQDSSFERHIVVILECFLVLFVLWNPLWSVVSWFWFLHLCGRFRRLYLTVLLNIGRHAWPRLILRPVDEVWSTSYVLRMLRICMAFSQSDPATALVNTSAFWNRVLTSMHSMSGWFNCSRSEATWIFWVLCRCRRRVL